jgi:hypothetical protein
MGMPSAIAPSSESVKTAMVTRALVRRTEARAQVCSSLSLTEIRSSSVAAPVNTRARS